MIDKDDLLQRAIDGADFLARMVKPNGKFVYGYKGPNTNKEIEGYNILRHAGCIWAMLVINEIVPNKEYMKKSKLALDWMIKKRVHFYKELDVWDDKVSMITEGGSAKLGGNGLATLALLKYNQFQSNLKYSNLAEELVDYISLFCVDSNGQFLYHKRNVKFNVATKFVSGFYPGEAVLALCEYDKYIGASIHSEMIKAIFDYHFRLRESTKHIRDHWMIQAIEQSGLKNKYQDYANSIAYEEIRTKPSKKPGPTACRSEALLSFLEISKDTNQLALMKSYLDKFIKKQMKMQVREGRHKGGFLWSPTNTTLRCDSVQHNICSFIRYYKLLKKEN